VTKNVTNLGMDAVIALCYQRRGCHLFWQPINKPDGWPGPAHPDQIKAVARVVGIAGVVNEVEDVAIVERHLWLDGVVWDPV